MSHSPSSLPEETHYAKTRTSRKYSPNEGEVVQIAEYLPGRLYFATFKTSGRPHGTDKDHFFTTDDVFIYLPFNFDFGPLCLPSIIRYCYLVKTKLSSIELRDKRIIHYTSLDRPYDRANATLLISAFAVLFLGHSPAEALERCSTPGLKVPPYRDASANPSSRHIRISDCLSALAVACRLRLFDPCDFDVVDCERARCRGDMSWVVPCRLLAFGGPRGSGLGLRPSAFVDYFKASGVVGVVRLNRPEYDAEEFERVGLRVHDLYFPDGTPPSRGLARHFLRLCTEAEAVRGALAVHCKAGLGRTGVLIASRLVSRYGLRPREAVAWLRLCRPGSIMSSQQEWLECNEGFLRSVDDGRRTEQLDPNTASEVFPFGIHSIRFGMSRIGEARRHRRVRRGNKRHAEGGKRRLSGWGTKVSSPR
ncbi:dual specificity protein phosphatase CDC14AB-like [Ischnura elegans]|uniref:dual specificity protein phosphatase CDC14AB-like n=1 Tax=Ischnura elegans TaxID=197161 RepID=UPI001ED87C58|nr:dual specificity protein phosphatase CDC14AB-like [Ischnura elegans]